MEPIRVSADGTHFVRAGSGRPFVVWGVNYDHDRDGRLIEDYWRDEWATVAEDFWEIRNLGANTVRVHLQLGRFMDSPSEPSAGALRQLARLVKLAEETGLYLDITGLGCYHRKDVPGWYDALDETGRWEAQALFWSAVARTCADSPAVFCYDLMNEPILPGEGQTETDWLAGEFAGKCFVQRIALGLAGRTQAQVAKAWVDRLVAAIRQQDRQHLVTVGVIPWAMVWPGARCQFHSTEAGANLDFASVHFYPEKGEVAKALTALAVYDVGKPLVIEEMFPLKCRSDELEAFIEGARGIAEGWISFYWGKTVDEYAAEKGDMTSALIREWLERFRAKGVTTRSLQ